MKLKYLAIVMCIASLFTACCEEDDLVEEILQASITLKGTWNEDRPKYVIQTTNLDTTKIKTVYLKEIFTDKHTKPETVKDRTVKFDAKAKIVLDKRFWPSQCKDVFKAVAYIQTDTATIKSDTVTLVHPSEINITLNGTWNKDHPKYEIKTTNLDAKKIKTIYLKEIFTDKHTIPETVKDRIVKLDAKDKIILDKRYWTSQGEEEFKAVAYIKTDTATIESDTVTLVHPSEWITTRRVINVPSGLCESSIFTFEETINQYSIETGELLKSYPWDGKTEARATFFTKEYMYYAIDDEEKEKKYHVYRLNLNTSKIEHLAYFTGTINRLWVDKSKIYICDLNTQLREINVKTNKAVLVEEVEQFNYFSMDEGYVYGSAGMILYRYKSGNPASIEQVGILPSGTWQRIAVQDGWLYYVDDNILCKTKISTLNNKNRECIKLGCPFEPTLIYGNSLQMYTDGKYYYLRMKFNGMLVSKKRLVDYKP